MGAASGAEAEWHEDANGSQVVGSAADVLLTAKWRVLNDERHGLLLALAPLVKLPLADDTHGLGTGGTDYDLTLPVTKSFGRTFIDLNIGYTLADDPANNDHDGIWHYGFAVRRPLNDSLWIAGDVFAVTPTEMQTTTVGTDLGLQYQVSPNVVLDTAVGTGLHDGADVTATVGMTWLF